MITVTIIVVVYLIVLSIFIYKFFDTGKYRYFALVAITYALCGVTFITMAILGIGYKL